LLCPSRGSRLCDLVELLFLALASLGLFDHALLLALLALGLTRCLLLGLMRDDLAAGSK
jgi:hypothetical protein